MRRFTFVVGWVALLGVACAPPEPGEETRASEIVNGTPSSDSVGNVNIDAICSARTLSPQWIITVGHCFEDNGSPPFFQTSTIAFLGNQTTNGINSSDFYMHPYWWHSGLSPTQRADLTDWDSSYDVALLRLPTPFSSTGYANNLYNQLSNGSASVGDAFTCWGYGNNVVPNQGGGLGDLQSAVMNVNAIGNPGGLSIVNGQPMIGLAPNASGQIIYNHDSGGTCSRAASPYVITGINTLDVLGNGVSGAPTGAYESDPWYYQPWVDATMHSSEAALPALPVGCPVNSVRSASVNLSPATSGTNNLAMYAVLNCAPPDSGAGYYLSFNWPAARGKSGWSGWYKIAKTGLPTGGTMLTDASIAVTNNGGSPLIHLAAVMPDHNLYVTDFSPGTNPPNVNVTWTSAGGPSGLLGSVTPGIGTIGTTRLDYFATGRGTTSSTVYTRWKLNGVWQSGWTVVTSGVNVTSLAAAFGTSGLTYFLVGAGTDGTPYVNFLEWIPNPSVYGGTWTGWYSLGGQLLGDVAVSAWSRGVDFYGVGTDNQLYHQTVDADSYYSDWMPLGGAYSGLGVSASNADPSVHQIAVTAMSSSNVPSFVVYPR